MKQILLGRDRKYLIVKQWFVVFLFLLYLRGCILLSIVLFPTFGILAALFFLLLSIMIYLQKCKFILSLNLIIRKEDDTFVVKNFIRKHTFSKKEINWIRILQTPRRGILQLKTKKKYAFPLDKKHIELKYILYNDKFVVAEYYQRLQLYEDKVS